MELDVASGEARRQSDVHRIRTGAAARLSGAGWAIRKLVRPDLGHPCGPAVVHRAGPGALGPHAERTQQQSLRSDRACSLDGAFGQERDPDRRVRARAARRRQADPGCGDRGSAGALSPDRDDVTRLHPRRRAARARERRRRQRTRVDRHYGVHRDDRLDLPGGAVRAAVLCGGAACRGMAQDAQGPLAGGYAGRIAGRVEAAAARSLQPLWNLLTQRQSQFGRRDSYGIPGFQHTKIAMARFALRVTTASALIFAAVTAADPVLRQAWAQESERPFGLFGIFNGSERMGGSAPGGGAERTAQGSAPDLMLRIDRLETQIRQLTGAIEQLQFRNQQLEGEVRRMQEAGVPRGAVQSRPQNLPAPSSPAATAGRRGDAFDPAQNPNAPGAPHTLGAINPPGGAPIVGADAGEPPVGAPGGRGAAAPLDLATMGPPSGPQSGQSPQNPAAGGALATLAPSQTPRDEYDLAYGYVLRKDYALAEDAFHSFLSKYPNDRLAGDATYWLGESMFQRRRFRDAAEAFLNVSTKYESTAKAPDALLRLGQSLAALGEKEAACASLGEVLRKFPRASAAVRQGVEREQKRVRC